MIAGRQERSHHALTPEPDNANANDLLNAFEP